MWHTHKFYIWLLDTQSSICRFMEYTGCEVTPLWEIHTPLTLAVWWKLVLLCQGVVLPKGCEYLAQHPDSLKRQFRESPPPPRTPVSPRSLDHLLTMAVLHYWSDPVVTWFPHAYPGHPESPGGPVQIACGPPCPPRLSDLSGLSGPDKKCISNQFLVCCCRYPGISLRRPLFWRVLKMFASL